MIIINADNSVNMSEIEQEHLLFLKDNVLRKLNAPRKGGNRKGTPHIQKLYTYLKNNIDTILIGDPDKIDRIITHITTDMNINFTKVNRNSPLYKELKKIFDYDAFVASYPPKKVWGAYQLVSRLNVKVCPYCNRQYIFTVHKVAGEGGQTRGRLDHFYDKATYPYLALSLYNLIPCCNICNSDLKGSIQFSTSSHIHPYKEEFGDHFKFSLKMKSGKSLKAGDTSQINYLQGIGDEFDVEVKALSIDQNFNEKVRQNLSVFKIEELYNMHKDYIMDLIKKKVMYSESQIDELYNLYQGSLFASREDVIQTITSNYLSGEHLDKRVLAKLTRDISEELNLYIT